MQTEQTGFKLTNLNHDAPNVNLALGISEERAQEIIRAAFPFMCNDIPKDLENMLTVVSNYNEAIWLAFQFGTHVQRCSTKAN